MEGVRMSTNPSPEITSQATGAAARVRSRTEIARALNSALNAHDPDGIVAQMHPDASFHFIPIGTYTGREDVRAFFAELHAAIPDVHLAIEADHEVGDVVTHQWSASGTFNGASSFQGIKPTGRRVQFRGVDVMEFEGDLLRRNTIYYDGLLFARQIGLLPRQGSAGDRGLLRLFNTVTRFKGLFRRR
jgi:predicted ester cyclase